MPHLPCSFLSTIVDGNSGASDQARRNDEPKTAQRREEIGLM
jgi:hypothetical protein